MCPVLGKYENSEPQSIVIMDNASTHLNRQVGDLIEPKGAYLLYTAPYLPDLNPIELGFDCYKKSLKRNSRLGIDDWFEDHFNAIESLSRDTSIKECRRCGVPFSNDV